MVRYQNGANELTEPTKTIRKRDGTQVQIWMLNGERHRLDGPATLGPNGYEGWYENGKIHRLDGPAIVQSDGREGWWIRDRCITDKVKKWIKDNEVGPWASWDQETWTLFRIWFS